MGFTLPCREALGGFLGHPFPPDITLGRQSGISEDGVTPEHLHGRGIGRLASARGDSEEACLGVDRAKFAIATRAQPGDVIAEGFDLPAGEAWAHHREIGLATGARERGSHRVGLALGARHFHEQHVFG